MNRRRALVLAAGAWPALKASAVTHAQPSRPANRILRVGILRLFSGKAPQPSPLVNVFTAEMQTLGWIEGRNVVYDLAFAEGGDEARLAKIATELVARRPDLIYLQSNTEMRAALAATRDIPIVFSAVIDPVAEGFVKSLAQPGANITGVATIGWELGGKRMQLLKEALPHATQVAVLTYAPRQDSLRELQLIEKAAGSAVKIVAVDVKQNSALDEALSAVAVRKPQALVMTHIAFFMGESKRILDFTERHRIPVIAHRSEVAERGALFTYNSNLVEQVRRAAHLADKVLKGIKPADIPIEQPTKFELVINLKTAKALGITIPQSVLLQASRVIE